MQGPHASHQGELPPWIATTLGSAFVSCTKQESLDIQSWCFRKEHPLPPYVIQRVCPQGQLLQGCVTIFPGHRRGYSPISEGSEDVHSFSASWAGPGVRGFKKMFTIYFSSSVQAVETDSGASELSTGPVRWALNCSRMMRGVFWDQKSGLHAAKLEMAPEWL